MDCDELIEIIRDSEKKCFELLDEPAPLLTVACRAYMCIQPVDCISFAEQTAKLFQLAAMVEMMREGLDPRCNKCIAQALIREQQRKVEKLIQ